MKIKLNIMKIAVFTDTFDEINGVASVYQRLVEYCIYKNIHLELFALSNKTSVEEKNNVKIHRIKTLIPMEIQPDLSFDLIWLNPRLVSYFRNNKFDLIHVATPGTMGLNALLLSRIYKIPIIATYHTHIPEYVKERVNKIIKKTNLKIDRIAQGSESLTWEFMKIYYNRFKLVLAPSEYTKKYLEEKLKIKIEIFSHGVDINRFNPKKRNEEFRKNNNLGLSALYVGRIAAEKNLDFLVEIFNDFKDVKLVLVGDGPHRKDLEKKGNALFFGFKTGDELAQIYSSCDFFVFPSTTDSFGMVILEAMASGLPVLVSDKGGPREIVLDKINGFIIKSNDKKEWMEKINLIVKDAKLRKKFGIMSRDLALRMSWEKVFDELFKTYEKFLDERNN